MPVAVRLPEFLERHGAADPAALGLAFPLGCLLDARDPVCGPPEAVTITPLVRDDGRAARVVVGRDPAACDVVLGSPSVSRRHACLDLHDGRIVLVDLGSVSGTLLSARRLEPTMAAPLPADGISEVWFGDEGFLHFGPIALGQLLRHVLRRGRPMKVLGKGAPPAPVEPPAAPSPLPCATTRRSRLGALMQRLEDQLPGTAEAVWSEAVTAVVRLGPQLRAVEVTLDDGTVIRVHDAERDPHGLPDGLTLLTGLRDRARRVVVHLRRGEEPMVLLDLGEGA
jgi:hypothetical protein